VIDLSVEVDSLFIIDYCIKSKSMYINTSLENWHEEEKPMHKEYKKFKDDTLYHRELLLDKKLKTSKSTIVIDHGFNPGIIQTFALTALDLIAKEYDLTLESKEEYAEFAKAIELVSIQVVEFDNQLTNLESYDDLFLNTWSSLGFQAEGTDHCMFGLGTLDDSFKDQKLIIPDEGHKNVRFIAEHSMNLMRDSVTLDNYGVPFEYSGMLITHGESNTLSDYLTTKDGSYRPSVYYVYSPSEVAWGCLQKVRDNDYHFLDYWHVLTPDDIIDEEYSFDSIGALLTLKDGRKFWSGSVLTNRQTREMGFKYAGTATTVQVASSVNSAITYMINNPKEGYCTPEYLRHREILKLTAPFLGNLFFGYI
jgi:homospermidine synthase